MILRDEDAALFYRAWGALLTWANDQRNIVPRFPRPTPGHPIAPSLAVQIKKVVWAEDVLREQFLAEGAAHLGDEERDLIASWKHRVSEKFILLKHLQKHSIFMGKDVYCVLGIYTPFEVMFPNVPMFVEAVLLPFRDVIITDGLLQSPPVQISFGGGARRGFNAQYGAARAASEIRTALPWREPERHETPAQPRAPRRKPSRRRPSTKQILKQLIDELPDDATIEDVQRRLHIIDAVNHGRDASGAGTPHEQVAANLRAKWGRVRAT